MGTPHRWRSSSTGTASSARPRDPYPPHRGAMSRYRGNRGRSGCATGTGGTSSRPPDFGSTSRRVCGCPFGLGPDGGGVDCGPGSDVARPPVGDLHEVRRLRREGHRLVETRNRNSPGRVPWLPPAQTTVHSSTHGDGPGTGFLSQCPFRRRTGWVLKTPTQNKKQKYLCV